VDKFDGATSDTETEHGDIERPASLGADETLDASAWRAELTLRFARVGARTMLVERSHVGPLRLLKPLYPEGDANCHAVIVHPPGGIVAGDELAIAVHVEANAHGVIVTPGAQKWYRSAARGARSTTTIAIENDATLEWLPQESMVFDGAMAQQNLTIRLAPLSRLFAWEIVCLGRATRCEQFTSGRFRQRIEIERDSVPLWQEHTRIDGGDALLASPIGWGGHSVMATAWIACGVPDDDSQSDASMLDLIRAALALHANAGASNPAQGFFVVKAIGNDTESVRDLLIDVWSRIRFKAFGLHAQRPRIWNT
jgi:urease accessory protein